MIRFKSQKIKFAGDVPQNKKAKSVLIKSGYFENLYQEFFDEDRYGIGKPNRICTHAFKQVDPELSDRLIRQASIIIWGEERRCQGVQRVLVEVMQNTFDHAVIEKEGERHWWLSVNHDEREKKVSFSFVDYGVGVFKSLDQKKESNKFFGWANKLKKNFMYGDNSELLKLILMGKLHETVTGKPNRGKGLPGIRQVLERNQISNLHIITNNVFADVANDRYEILEQEFDGTFIYWELNENNLSII